MSKAAGRLIVVLGYSDGGKDALHPVCAERLEHAATIATENDVVVLSGWARVPGTQPEAELMATAWHGRARELVIDPVARTTVDNATNAVDDVHRTRPAEVIVVTSRWHAPRAAAVFKWRLRRSDAKVVVAASASAGSIGDWLRELPSWLVLPLQLSARHRRRAAS